MRTQEEILSRFQEVDDMLGTQKGDLIDFMEFEIAKPFLSKEYLESIGNDEKKWEMSTDPKSKILGYLDFAYEKAE